jgi:BRCA1-associated protein
LIRKRPVSFGISRNYHGNIYTIPGDDSDCDGESVEEDSKPLSLLDVNRRIVAMIDVPPEHVPEGILNLIASHRPYVEHVRVVIADSDDDDDGDGEDGGNDDGGDEKEEVDNNENNFVLDDDSTAKQRRDRTYLILVQLFREEDATTFVEDLDGKPYIAFDDRDTCRIERVVGVEKTATISDTAAEFLSGHPKGPPQSGGYLSNIYQQSLPLLHLNFGSGSFDNTVRGEPPQEEEKTEQKNSGCAKTSSKCEDSSINCAVCLEDLGLEEKMSIDRFALLKGTDRAASAVCPIASQPSLLTTVCNHTFHLDCLERCTGPCPVCRYDHSGLNETLSQCHVCGTTEHNYVCLICGVVSCGLPRTAEAVPPVAAAAAAASSSSTSSTTAPARFYTSSHAGQHYKDTLHAYALDTQTQHVYDFCGQGYVHRLVQNKEDGKIVEVNDPRQSAAVARGGRAPGERSLTPGLSDAQEGEVVHRKLEGAAERYNNLLKSQLEQQRAYYEERLNDVRREFSAEHQKAKAQDLLAVLRQERKQVNQRLSTLQRRKTKVTDTVSFLKNMNESLVANKAEMKHRIQQAVREQSESKEMIQKYLPGLEAKVAALTKQLFESED